jgi:hypothetical protein
MSSNKIGHILPGHKSPADYFAEVTSGYYKTVDVTVSGNIVIGTTYAGFICREIMNLHASADTVKYIEANDTENTKTLKIAVDGGRSGILPVISQINVTDTTATSLKLFLQKVGG